MGPHERVRIDLDDGESLYFLDVRKFGRITYVNDTEEACVIDEVVAVVGFMHLKRQWNCKLEPPCPF